eukprot:gnl/MRDRNA2_/MRDRNA2_87247_c0_seq1.p1 gnl/MRDRNA2_/MRDRNA2_87247_c0~~gnl/MRDRNA2_/MRDRNA2_87247_c0_seq1.p1  ORF type:complete len:173 (+),score=44.34 gnl/MRDRNA2_/MRDRNA2_87247_c0_seq1:81-599(+)
MVAHVTQTGPRPGDIDEDELEEYDDEAVDQLVEELQLEADIRRIEIDTALISLRGQLQTQEEHIAAWGQEMKDERVGANEKLRRDFEEAKKSLEAMQMRVRVLEEERGCLPPEAKVDEEVPAEVLSDTLRAAQMAAQMAASNDVRSGGYIGAHNAGSNSRPSSAAPEQVWRP